MRVILCDNYKCKKAISDSEVISLSITIAGKTDTYDLCPECYNKFMQEFIIGKETEEEKQVETFIDRIETVDIEPDKIDAETELVVEENTKAYIDEVETDTKEIGATVDNDITPKNVRKTYERKKKTVLATQMEIYGKDKLINEYVNNIYTAEELADKIHVSRASLVNYFYRNGITKKTKEKSVDASEKESHTLN